eukprot:TRINITY_DN9825_c0_g1_i1.p1 TRINITY_DN9825_c0_g1~~TRINITY_DN9825_c0_g1_i1.p1  ORF type:complete len:147 (+),score=26.86 TRINITY_DN9825_c0_g1_i1:70-510(+)
MCIRDRYKGPKLDAIESLSKEWIVKATDYMKGGNVIHKRYALMVIERANEIFRNESNMVKVTIPKGGEAVVCGDLHGQYKDLLAIFKLNGYPSEEAVFVFNGDFIDRGRNSIEVMLTLLLWKCVCPKTFFLIRGNHENKQQHKFHG